MATPERGLLSYFADEFVPLDFRIVGRTLLHAALVGAAAGLFGIAFFVALEYVQRLVLEDLAGYVLLRAHGETFVESHEGTPFRPWLLLFIPAIGALLGGIVTQLAPETRGGGGDRMIYAFHHLGGLIRRRVIAIKGFASILTLGFGGSGGREGPTMQIGGALGSFVGGLLKVGARERRILMVAGVAAGMSAVFRTPLGAALLAVEVLYRDDFETEALVPAILASVVSYAIVISVFGESVLFAHAPHYPFVAGHLPLYILLALFVALLGSGFIGTLHAVQRVTRKVPLPGWAKPAVGGLLLGAVAVPVISFVGKRIGVPGQGLGILGGGYGAVQMAITGSDWLPSGWQSVELLLILCFVKMIAASLTIGSGGSAGDFAPCLVLGGLLGGAFGHAARLILGDPRIDPGAFALVGMGTLYGGVAHVPVSSLIMVSELAGSYDLLVPMMLAEGVAFIALRNRSLYDAQVGWKSESPVHRVPTVSDALVGVSVSDVMIRDRAFVTFSLNTRAAEILSAIPDDTWQVAFPVLDGNGKLAGVITVDALRMLATTRESSMWTIAADLMRPPAMVAPEDDLRSASKTMLANGLREIPVVDANGTIIGFLDEGEAVKAYMQAMEKT